MDQQARDTLNNPSARLNFLCVELQSTDLFRPSLDRFEILHGCPLALAQRIYALR